MKNRLYIGEYDYAGYLIFASYSACMVSVPAVLLQISKDLEFNLGQGGALQLGSSIAMVVFLLVSGLIAGTLGTKRTITIGQIVMALGIFITSISANFNMLLYAFTLAGAGQGVLIGLTPSLINQLHTKEDAGRYLSILHSSAAIGVIAGVLIAGLLVNLGISWRIVLGFVVLFSLSPLPILIANPNKIKQQYREIKEKASIITNIVKMFKVLSSPQTWVYIGALFFAGGGEYCFLFWSSSYIQNQLNANAFTGAVATALLAIGILLGRIYFGAAIKSSNYRKTLQYMTLLYAILAIFFPLLNNIILVFIGLVILGFCTAPNWPLLQSYATSKADVDKTMLLVLISCGGLAGVGFFTYIIGVVSDLVGFKNSFYLVPICYVCASLFITLDKYIKKNT